MTRDEQGRILLVRSSSRSNFPGVWFLPGGGLDHGEDPAAGLRREFMEETGLQIEITGLREVTADLVEFPFRDVLLHHDRIIYDVRVAGGALTVETAGTTDLPDWVEPARLPDLELVPFAARALGLATADRNEVNQRPAVPDEAGNSARTAVRWTERCAWCASGRTGW